MKYEMNKEFSYLGTTEFVFVALLDLSSILPHILHHQTQHTINPPHTIENKEYAYPVGGLIVHNELVIDKVEAVRLCLVRELNHFIHYHTHAHTLTVNIKPS